MIKQGSPEWLAARKGRVTGSVAGAILGLDPNHTRAQVMRAMVREFHGAENEFTGNIATEYGKAMEDMAKLDYLMETGCEMREASFVPYEDWLGASPDGYVNNDGLGEVKCPFGKRALTDGEGFKSVEEQPHYYAQMQIEMLCASCSWVDFWQWAPSAWALDRVEYNSDWLAENVPKLRAFYDEYLDNILEPEEFLTPLRVEIDNVRAHQLVAEYREMKDAEDRAKERAKEILEQLVGFAGDKNAIIAGAKLTKVDKVGAVSYAEVVKKHLPNLNLDPYRGKPSSYWLLK